MIFQKIHYMHKSGSQFAQIGIGTFSAKTFGKRKIGFVQICTHYVQDWTTKVQAEKTQIGIFFEKSPDTPKVKKIPLKNPKNLPPNPLLTLYFLSNHASVNDDTESKHSARGKEAFDTSFNPVKAQINQKIKNSFANSPKKSSLSDN